jgi:glycosyltransferase involved in cell wall biosynthesis
MRLSYVIISYNRRERLIQTLGLLGRVTPLPQDQWEICVVDNASTDGSADQVAQDYPNVKLIRNPVNEGMFARNHAFERCAGKYIISIDDDSYPENGHGVLTALAHMDARPAVGAL